MANTTVSPAEVEKFRITRAAEREFLEKLMAITQELASKVDAKNSDLRSMQRFIKARI